MQQGVRTLDSTGRNRMWIMREKYTCISKASYMLLSLQVSFIAME